MTKPPFISHLRSPRRNCFVTSPSDASTATEHPRTLSLAVFPGKARILLERNVSAGRRPLERKYGDPEKRADRILVRERSKTRRLRYRLTRQPSDRRSPIRLDRFTRIRNIVRSKQTTISCAFNLSIPPIDGATITRTLRQTKEDNRRFSGRNGDERSR